MEVLVCTTIVDGTATTPTINTNPASDSNIAWGPLVLLPTSTASNVGMQMFDLRLYTDAAEVEAFE